VTDLCNFRCHYCMPPDGVPKLKHEDVLRLEELAAVVRLLVTRRQIHKVRITGGEPLIRRGLPLFLEQLNALPQIADLSLTTNGYFLAEMAHLLRHNGVQRVNVSLDTLRADRFEATTGVDGLARVLRGIAAARRAGLKPIKLNAVVMRSTLDEIADLLRFSLKHDLTIRFIELMPSHRTWNDEFVPLAEMLRCLTREVPLDPLASDSNPRAAHPSSRPSGITSRAARLYRIRGTDAMCGFIAPVSNPFCAQCDRLRLRGDGTLVPCLADVHGINLKPYLRPHLEPEALLRFIDQQVRASKAAAPQERRIRTMSQIGG